MEHRARARAISTTEIGILLEPFENIASSSDPRDTSSIERKGGTKTSGRCRRCGVVPCLLNFTPFQGIALRKSYSFVAENYPLKPVTWRLRRLTALRDASRRVALRANGVVCRVRGSQPGGKRALLLAERREGTPGTGAAEKRGWVERTRTCARRSVRAREIAEVR